MSNLAFIGYCASVMLNAVLIVTLVKKRRANTHAHTWTPWSDWQTLESYSSRSVSSFTRVRYCETCALEQKQEVGRHYCDDLNLFVPARERHCSHRALYTEIFDPMYELKQINKDLEELQ